MMQKLLLGIIAALMISPCIGPTAEGGHRRNSRRARVQYVPVAAAATDASADSAQAAPTAALAPLAFPDVCPIYPLFYDQYGDLFWYAESHRGGGGTCEDCNTEPAYLLGDYGFHTYEWPYPCGHEQCQPTFDEFPPSANLKANVKANVKAKIKVYRGAKEGAVDFSYSPAKEPELNSFALRHAAFQEVGDRKYYSFTLGHEPSKTRFFIAYQLRARKHHITIAHEVAESVLTEQGVTIKPLSADELKPARETDPTPYVYVYTPDPLSAEPDPILFILKR